MTIPSQHPSKQRCAVCAGPLTVHQAARGGLCDAPSCRRAALDRARVDRARSIYRDHVAEPDREPLVIVPAAVLTVGPLPERKRRRFEQHLYDVVRAAFTPGVVVEPYAPTLAPTSSEAAALAGTCALCQGHCCMTGGDHAWVDVDAVRRARSLHPGIRPAGVVDLYLDHLPTRACLGSCVFHTPSGCALPFGIRGSVCNGYHCPGLLEVVRGLRQGARRIFAVAMDGLVIVRFGSIR